MRKLLLFKYFLVILRAAVIDIPRTPIRFKKETICERKRLYERDEGEVWV